MHPFAAMAGLLHIIKKTQENHEYITSKDGKKEKYYQITLRQINF